MKLKFTKKLTIGLHGIKLIINDDDSWSQTQCKYSDSFIIQLKKTCPLNKTTEIITREFRFELENIRCLYVWDSGKTWEGEKANYRLTLQRKDNFRDSWNSEDVKNLENLYYTDCFDKSENYHTRKEALKFVDCISMLHNKEKLKDYCGFGFNYDWEFEILNVTKQKGK